MPYGLYMSAEGAHAQSLRMEVIANNIANVDTVGFKRELAIVQAREAEEIEQGTVAGGMGYPEDIGGGVELIATETDHSMGPLNHTKLKTDVAIHGEGFFMVRDNEEETFLTRAGNFEITSGGNLVTQQGYAVLDDAGSPIRVDPTDPNWNINTSGQVRSIGGFQNLALVKPQSYGDLVKMGKNLFRPLADPEPILSAQRSVAPGYLEGSAVKPTSEMTEMIQAARAMEANINMMQTQDQMLSSLVNRVMRVG